MLLTASDFSISDSEFSTRIADSVDALKFTRDREIKSWKRIESFRDLNLFL